MGLYYKLANGEDIEIRITENDEDFTKTVDVLLFGGSTVLSYPLQGVVSLNNIISSVEKDYEKLLREDMDFGYRCYAD